MVPVSMEEFTSHRHPFHKLLVFELFGTLHQVSLLFLQQTQ